MGTYACTLEAGGKMSQVCAAIINDAVEFSGQELGRIAFSYADIMDLRLLNYRLHVRLRDNEAIVSKLGHQTEAFFEKLWQAYAAKSERALFAEGTPIMTCEGDYAYAEPGASASSIAKLVLYPDCLCVVPHGVGARRVPFCFAETPVREGFSLGIQLDTGESYHIARLGRETNAFFSKLTSVHKGVHAAWIEAHRQLERDLDERLGKAKPAHEAFCALPDGTDVIHGLFSANEDDFWFAAVRPGHAAVELVTNEQSATYLYRFETAPASFVAALRHAMEALKTNRRVIFMPQDELDAEPLYRMAIDRSTHVRFLRSCNVGRIIHTNAWEDRLRSFFCQT